MVKETQVKKEFKFNVIEECGTVTTRTDKKYGKRELKVRYGSWNDYDPKYDVRWWYTDDEGKERNDKIGTLSGEELVALGEFIIKLKES